MNDVPAVLRRPFPVLCVAALMAACATTKVDPEVESYTQQMKTNKARYEACTRGYTSQYAQSETASNASVISAAMKQCALYARNYCHAQVQREVLIAGGGVLPPDAETGAESTCLQTLTGERRAALRAELAKSRPRGVTPGTAAP